MAKYCCFVFVSIVGTDIKKYRRKQEKDHQKRTREWKVLYSRIVSSHRSSLKPVQSKSTFQVKAGQYREKSKTNLHVSRLTRIILHDLEKYKTSP